MINDNAGMGVSAGPACRVSFKGPTEIAGNDNPGVYASEGGFVGGEFEIRPPVQGLPRRVRRSPTFFTTLTRSAIAAQPGGEFVVVWSGGCESSYCPSYLEDLRDVLARRYRARSVADGIFSDGFASGDTSAWWGAVP